MYVSAWFLTHQKQNSFVFVTVDRPYRITYNIVNIYNKNVCNLSIY